MPQLVGISHHIDCGDLSVLDFERGRLEFAVGLQRDEAGQSIDESGTHKFRAILLEVEPPDDSCTFMTASNPTIGSMAAGRLPPPSAWTLTSAASIAPSAFMSPLREAVKKASASSRPRCLSTWKRGLASRTWVRARAASWRQAAGSRWMVAATSSNSEPEHIVQQEGRPLERRKAFQRQHQRQGDVFLFVLFDDGIGKPGTDIGLALAAR